VINTQKVGFILIFEPENSISVKFYAFAVNSSRSYWAMTESTSTLMRLNSSKQHHAPEADRPLKNLAIMRWSMPSEQLKTTHCFARALAKSLVDSVLPVPAGPAGAPPKLSLRAPIRVM